jgi:hypothetical protein
LTTVHSAPLFGSQPRPFGLRRPEAKVRRAPLLASTSQISARPSSSAMPCSATLLFEPVVTYSFEPSREAIRFLVQ